MEPYTDFTTGETKVLDDPFPPGMMPCIEKFFATDHQRPRELDSYDDVFASDLFFPLQRQRELEKMIRIARSINPVTVMEIGADKGGGVYHWVKCLPTVQVVVACEIRGIPYYRSFEEAFQQVQFLWGPVSSRGAEFVDSVDKFATGRIDILFIDGDKSAFAQDFDAYLPMMNPLGIVFMHDIQDSPGPKEAFEQIKSRGYRTEEIIDISESTEALARGVAGVPPRSPHEGWLRHWGGRSCGVGVIYLDGSRRA